ncbi:homeobox protein ceh-1-like [Tetranychus urticae]|uniref:homeobox protein ceh-1-like n=1 Tax=Tetranychus urticae TaxID=32264 RepID=UPI00077C0C28|nr:homeobox protein ceh-1-like [Tetranychus urticae]
MVGIEKRIRRQRYTFTKQQIQGLEAEFTKCRTPNHTTKDEIAKKWKLTRSIVSNWFKNRRTKAKKEGSKENSAPPPPPPSTTLGPVISRDQPQLPPSPPLEFINQSSMSFQPLILYQPLMPIQPALMESLIPIELPMSPASSSSSYADFSHCLSEILNN